MIRRFYLGLLWLSLLSSNGFASEAWSEKQNRDGIKIEVRKLQNQKYEEIRQIDRLYVAPEDYQRAEKIMIENKL